MSASEKSSLGYRYIGARRRAKEHPRFVTGRGRFVADIALPGMKHVALVASPHAAARIVSIRTEAALAAPGVLYVLAGDEFCANTDSLAIGVDAPKVTRWALARGVVRYAGEWVAAVVADSRALAEDAAELGEQRGEGRLRGVRRPFRPERVRQLAPRRAGGTVRRQVREEEPALPARKLRLHTPACDLHHEPSAELDPRAFARRQRFPKVTPRARSHNGPNPRRRRIVNLVVNCECGETVRAEDDGELVAQVEAHVERNHPEMVGKLSRDDILGMAEEE